MPSPDPEQLTGRLRGLLQPVVEAAGFELDAVEVRAAGRRQAVTVVVDRPEDPSGGTAGAAGKGAAGIGLDEVAKLSRTAAAELDEHEHLISGAYTLEVTSPGVDRPLTRPRDWRRAWLRSARIRLADGTEFDARVGPASETGVRVAVPGKKAPTARDLDYAEVAHAQVQVEFKEPPAAEVALLDPAGSAAGSAADSDIAEENDR